MASFPCPWCNAAVAAEPLGPRFCPACGETLVFGGRFLLEGRLGSGGMSVVYAARAETGGERAAVKILTFSGAKEWNVLDLFDHGARVLMGVRHPGLPLVYDLSQDQKGRHILVREAFDGGTLEERVLREGWHLEPAAFHRLFEALLGVVAYLHGLVPPVLHRDIKPSNIMFRTRADWNPVLVDFDTVALPPERRSGLTVVGTPGYAAPEQFYGEAVPASDLYGLAATMLFVATHTDVNQLPRAAGRFLLEGRLSSIDPRDREVMLKLLEPDPAKRPAHAGQVFLALRSGGAPPPAPLPRAPTPAPGPRGPAPGPRRGLITVSVAGAAFLALGAVAGGVLLVSRPPPPPVAAEAVVAPEPPAAPDAPAAKELEAEKKLAAERAEEARQRRKLEAEARRERAREAVAGGPRQGQGLNSCLPVVPCYQETEEFGQVAGRLEIVVDAGGKVTKAAYSKGKASAKVRRCLVKAARALEVPAEATRPATHVCQWSGTIMGGTQMMMFDRKVIPAGGKAGK